ncbi:hypothetical protein JOB18_029580 [Solea senegalensis]|uniref:Uncharacterized protein n=1 Tax=Solea senegalensis TaxID=28829 RepID=A0AAV6QJD6_SOLSE|nr:hypothetical protein JOB18_029580 [Solea senegalensis]
MEIGNSQQHKPEGNIRARRSQTMSCRKSASAAPEDGAVRIYNVCMGRRLWGGSDSGTVVI